MATQEILDMAIAFVMGAVVASGLLGCLWPEPARRDPKTGRYVPRR